MRKNSWIGRSLYYHAPPPPSFSPSHYSCNSKEPATSCYSAQCPCNTWYGRRSSCNTRLPILIPNTHFFFFFFFFQKESIPWYIDQTIIRPSSELVNRKRSGWSQIFHSPVLFPNGIWPIDAWCAILSSIAQEIWLELISKKELISLPSLIDNFPVHPAYFPSSTSQKYNLLPYSTQSLFIMTFNVIDHSFTWPWNMMTTMRKEEFFELRYELVA